jgi:1,4-dihydroxy-2-naphthoate octaprenyltransferase
MLESSNTPKTEKDLKFLLGLNIGFSILTASLLIIFNAISYFSTGNFHLIPSIVFILIFFWCLRNVDYLKKELKNRIP